MPNRCYLYARISTDLQSTEAQLTGLHAAARQYPTHQVIVIEDRASGAVPWRQRPLATVLIGVNKGDVLIVPEISRIGRNTADVLDFVAHAANDGLIVRVEKSGLTIGQDMQSKIITTVLALAAEIERDFLRSRTREGMEAARLAGKTIGRPRGPTAVHFLDAKREEIARLTALGVPKVSIAKIVGASARSVTTHLQRYPRGTT